MTLYDTSSLYDTSALYDVGYVPPGESGYTLGDMTDDILRQLRGTTRDAINLLGASLDAPTALTSETISFQNDLDGITVGALLSVTTTDETMYVMSANPSAGTAQVLRGYDDTTPEVAPDGTVVLVDPPWPRQLIKDRIKDEIRKWGPQVYGVANVQIPIVMWQRGYDLGAIVNPIAQGGLGLVINRILKVTAPEPPYIGSPGFWFVPGSVNTTLNDPAYPFRYDPKANPAEFPSGASITLTGLTLPTYVGNLNVIFATPYDVDTSWADTTDLINDVGLDERDLDIPPLGVTARLLRMVAVRRAMLNVQGQSRDDQAVSMQAILEDASQFEQERDKRLGDAQQRLLSDYPWRSSLY